MKVNRAQTTGIDDGESRKDRKSASNSTFGLSSAVRPNSTSSVHSLPAIQPPTATAHAQCSAPCGGLLTNDSLPQPSPASVNGNQAQEDAMQIWAMVGWGEQVFGVGVPISMTPIWRCDAGEDQGQGLPRWFQLPRPARVETVVRDREVYRAVHPRGSWRIPRELQGGSSRGRGGSLKP